VLDEPIERLMKFRLLLIDTALGRLDILREVTPIGECADLDTIEMELLGRRVRVISRTQLIRVKRTVGRPKDLEVVAELEALAEADD